MGNMAIANAISLENAKPGNPSEDWELRGPGSSNIEGFTSRFSVNQGSPVFFKIDTDCRDYRIDIYRLGYYDGLGARHVARLNQTCASVQPDPLRDPATGLVDCCNWAITASWNVPADAVSGVYIAKLVRQDGIPGESHVPFVVRCDDVPRDIVFQTADPTWQAYNGWGGVNLYGGDATCSPNGRAFKVSYNRPFVTREGDGTYAGPQDFVFGPEYAAIRWFERNGYDIAYISGVDTGPGGARLTDFKVFASVGHDEYWSGDQRAHVEAARDAGVHLMFLSGNEVFWKTRWEPDAAGTPHRTLVTYKETSADAKIDPSAEWTGTWRDPRFSPPSDGGRPENALTGTIFMVDSCRADTIEVPHDRTQLRFWRNAPLAGTPRGQVAKLAPGMLGYEWDEAPDNGHRPAGLVHLSETTVPVTSYVLDYGQNLGSALATHRLTLYRAASGAIVFGAGTVFWSFGLDTDHDYCNLFDDPIPPTPEDANAQQLMVNLLAEMSVQPAMLQEDLVAAKATTDREPPVSIVQVPDEGTRLVVKHPLTISGTAADADGLVAAVEVSTNDGATWHPAVGGESWSYMWLPLHPGRYSIRTRAIDDSLNIETPGPGVLVDVEAD